MSTQTLAPTLNANITLAIGGYLVSLDGENHFVKKEDRQCTCGEPACPAIAAVRRYVKDGGQVAQARPTGSFPCPVCGAPAFGHLSLRQWSCSADSTHLYAWRTARLRAKRDQWLAALPEEARAIHTFMRSPERDQWVQDHRLRYDACG